MCQRLQISLVSLVLLFLSSDFPKYCSSKKASVLKFFQFNLSLLYWSPINVVISCRREKTFYNLMIKSQCLEYLSLNGDVHKCFFRNYCFFPLPCTFFHAIPFLTYYIKALSPIDYVYLFVLHFSDMKRLEGT